MTDKSGKSVVRASTPAFDVTLPANGVIEQLSPLVRRRICPNAGPFTASGTCSYIVGTGSVAVIDPGPDDASHIEALVSALNRERIEAIFVTHTHRDHSPGARLLRAMTGAPIVGCSPHFAAREVGASETMLDASVDRDHRPDQVLEDGESLSGDGWTLTAVATPGHTMNHLAFAFRDESALFSGDHVMGWSTTVVAPPDGSMRAYMASLDRLRDRTEAIFWPGHGGPVRDPKRFVRGLAAHRRQREAAIRTRIEAGDRDIWAIVAVIYQGLKPTLRGAAALSVFAHLEDMVERGIVRSVGPIRIDGRFEPA